MLAEHKIHEAKALGFKFVEGQSFIKRPGIEWRWGGAPFNGYEFGSSLGGVIDCFLQSGLHDLAHCIDFMMRGKPSRITKSGLLFNTYWEKWIECFGIFDGCPRTADMTMCEARTFALQAYIMNKELGFIVDSLDLNDEMEMRALGLLSKLKESKPAGHVGFRRDTLLKEVSIEEYAADKGQLEHLKWKDHDQFLSLYGFGYKSGMPYADRRQKWKECFSRLIVEEYQRLDNPFVEARMSKAITAVASKIRKFRRESVA